MLYVESYLSGDDAAHIEQIFDDLGLDTGISFDGVEPLLEFVTPEFADAEDMRPTQHCIQWRAKFVAERREKLVLHAARPLGPRARLPLAVEEEQSLAIGRLGLLHRLFKGPLRVLSLGNVASHLGRANYMASGILDRRYRDGDAELPPVFGEANGFEMIEAFAAPDAGKDLQFLRLAIRWDQSHDRRADHFVGGVSEDALRPEIPTGDGTV